jgi:predicted amidohydrolase YtcJ
MISGTPKKNMLLHSGRIYTQNPEHPFFEAVAIADGRIIWLGLNDDLYKIPPDKFEIIDLKGKTVLPSFCDAHLHFVFWALSLTRLDLDGCKSYNEVLNRIKKAAKTLKKNEWLIGKGWQRDHWTRNVWPHKRDLDMIVLNNPVALLSKDEHLTWTNTIGLKKANITANTPDPSGGVIVRDEHGELTGILKETASHLFFDKVPRPVGSKAFNAIDQAQNLAHSLGITSIGCFDGISGFTTLQQYHRKHGLKLRINQYIPSKHSESLLKAGIRSGLGDRFLKIQGVKFFGDGALGSQTALMFNPYRGSKDKLGIAQNDADELAAGVKRCVQGGLNVAIHAIGDRANRNALDAIINASSRKNPGFRHRIEHCQLLRKKDIPLFGKHNIVCSVQPSHLISDIDLVKKYWGQRGRHAYAFNTLQEKGAVLSFGSDGPIEKPNPLYDIYCAVTRKRPADNTRFYPVEKISVDDAVRAHTWGGAYAAGTENEYGSITIGNYADIVILDQNIYKIAPDKILDTKIIATFLEGEIVYGKDSFDPWWQD